MANTIYLVVALVVCCYLAYRFPLKVSFTFIREVAEDSLDVSLVTPRERAAGETVAFLESRPWYQEWKECLLASTHVDVDKESFLRGESGKDSVLNAFPWSDSPQGWDVWKRRNDEFLGWYYGRDDENVKHHKQ